MKKTIIFIISTVVLIIACQAVKAETVSFSDAEKVAQTFFANRASTKASSPSVSLAWDGSNTKALAAPFYVFNYSDSFVIVAGDDGMSPVLGYSTANSFDSSNIPDGLNSLFECYRRNVEALRQGKATPIPSAAAEWAGMLSVAQAASNPVTVVDLKTALWNQGSPYNGACPVLGDDQCLTGCGATALAILMKYYEFPNQAYGTLSGYITTSQHIDIPPKTIDYPYLWDKMTDQYTSSSTPEQKAAVATLMADIGQAIFADYGVDVTWAYTSSILPAMLEHMKYSNKAAIRERINYSVGEWTDLLKGEIDARHPVFYRGSGYEGGHFYIVDGYDSEGRFHYNWGWGGYDNGFFYFADTDYSSGEDAIIGLVPDANWTEPTISSTLSLYNDDFMYFGIYADRAYIENNVQTSINVAVFNHGTSAYNGRIKICLRHADGTLEDLNVSDVFTLNQERYKEISFLATIPDISVGDEIVACYEVGSKWELLDGGAKAIPLRYSLPDIISFSYEKDLFFNYNSLVIKGMKGMKLSCPGMSDLTFSKPIYRLANPGTGDYTLSNGHESYTVHLTF